MNKDYSYGAHNICLIAVVIFASGALSVPYKAAKGNSLITFLAAAVLGVAALIIFDVLISLILTRGEGAFSKFIMVTGGVLLLFAATATAVDAVLAFSQFVGDVMLPQTEKWLIIASFAVTVLVFAISRESAILKFALVTAALNMVFMLLILLCSIGQLSFGNLFERETEIGKDFLCEIFKYFCKIFLPAVAALTFIKLRFPKSSGFNTAWGAILGTLLLVVSLSQSVMIFGESIAATTNYPYVSAVSTMTTGSLYTRPDGFAYVMLFASYIVKAGVSVSAAVMLIKRMIKKSRSS